MRRLTAAALALGLLAGAGAAHAAPKHARHDAQAASHCVPDNDGHMVCRVGAQRADGHPTASHAARRHYAGDPRPSRWCMWWLRRELGIPRTAFRPGEYNLARAGRYIGAPARGPHVGVIVVWRHHVGIITGKSAAGWIVKSGNDGGRVRERARSLRGVIAFRRPVQRWAAR